MYLTIRQPSYCHQGHQGNTWQGIPLLWKQRLPSIVQQRREMPVCRPEG